MIPARQRASNLRIIFLNVGGAHADVPFTAFIPSTSAEKFPDYKKLDGATITVSGKITSHNDKAEIVVRDPDQLTIKEAAAETKGTPRRQTLARRPLRARLPPRPDRRT